MKFLIIIIWSILFYKWFINQTFCIFNKTIQIRKFTQLKPYYMKQTYTYAHGAKKEYMWIKFLFIQIYTNDVYHYDKKVIRLFCKK
jgi:hypothetical protein